MSIDGIEPGRTAIVILNWNDWKDTIECLESVYRIDYPNYDVILVDNGSTDDSVDRIKDYCKGRAVVDSSFMGSSTGNKPIRMLEHSLESDLIHENTTEDDRLLSLPSNSRLILIRNGKNCGYAEGNNIGIRYALKNLSPEYILLLNNDTVVDQRSINELVATFSGDSRIGAVEPLVYCYDNPTCVQFSGGGRIDFYRGACIEDIHPKRGENDKVGCLTGCCFLVSRELIENVGVMDPDFFLYWEEADWSVRMLRSGFKILFNPSARIWHKGGNTTRKIGEVTFYYSMRNRILFMRKHASNLHLFCFSFVFLPIDMLLICGNGLIKKTNLGVLRVLVRAILDGVMIQVDARP